MKIQLGAAQVQEVTNLPVTQLRIELLLETISLTEYESPVERRAHSCTGTGQKVHFRIDTVMKQRGIGAAGRG